MRRSSPGTGDARRGTCAAVAGRGEVCSAMPALHDALCVGCGVGGACRRGGAGGRAGRAGGARRAGRVASTRWSTRHRCRRWTGSNVTSVTSPAACPTTTGCSNANGSAGNGSCAAGPTATPACVTPTSRSTPKPTPASPPSLDAAVAAERAQPEGDVSRTFDQLRADAFVTLATGPRAGGRRPGEVSMLIDYATLADGLHPHSVCETSDGHPVPPETIRRLACDATIMPDRPRHRRCGARPRTRPAGRHRRPTPSPARDVPDLWLPRLPGAVRRL